MSIPNRPADLAALVLPRPGSGRSSTLRWDALDRFTRELPRCRDRTAATRLFLATVHEALGAETVCCASSGTLAVEVVGLPVPPAWCRTLVRLALAESPGAEGLLLRSQWSAPAELGPPSPHSLAMVRLGKSSSTWAVALSFTPARTFQRADMTLLALARQLLVNACQHLRTQVQLRNTVLGLVRGFATVIDGRDSDINARHSERVARIALRLGEQMGLPAADLSDLYLAALLHDIGNIRTRDGVLQKPGPLTPEERASIREHPALGAAIVSGIPTIAHLAPIVRGHHEHYDGNGYPDGLAREDIPLLARALAVADSFEAMLCDRPYRAALCPQQIEAALTAGAGSQWDGEVIRHFLACGDEWRGLWRREADINLPEPWHEEVE